MLQDSSGGRCFKKLVPFGGQCLKSFLSFEYELLSYHPKCLFKNFWPTCLLISDIIIFSPIQAYESGPPHGLMENYSTRLQLGSCLQNASTTKESYAGHQNNLRDNVSTEFRQATLRFVQFLDFKRFQEISRDFFMNSEHGKKYHSCPEIATSGKC